MLESVPASLIERWWRYFQVEPWGDTSAELRNAQLRQTIYATTPGIKKVPTLRELVPDRQRPRPKMKQKGRLTKNDVHAQASQLRRFFAAVDS